MSGIVGSKLNIRGSGLVGSLGTDGQHLLSSGAGVTNVFETPAAAGVTTAEGTAIRQDINTLALKQAVTENQAAFNLPNSFIDQYEDDTGIGSTTTAGRNSSEYLEPGQVTTGTRTAKTITYANTCTHSTGDAKFGTSSINTGSSGNLYVSSTDFNMAAGEDWTIDWWSNFTSMGIWAGVMGLFETGSSATTQPSGATSPDMLSAGTTNLHYMRYNGHTSSDADDSASPVGNANTVAGNWEHYFAQRNGNNIEFGSKGYAITRAMTATGTPNNTPNFYIGRANNSFTGSCFDGYWDDIRISKGIARYTVASNAYTIPTTRVTTDEYTYLLIQSIDQTNGSTTFVDTPGLITATSGTGTVIGIANVPSSAQTKVSGVMNYKDAVGTATIGTDLKIYLTCNGGTNWTEAASYTAVTPVFSTGIKMVKLGETTCTSGSDVRYKAVWANQADGSKLTELHGIGLNY